MGFAAPQFCVTAILCSRLSPNRETHRSRAAHTSSVRCRRLALSVFCARRAYARLAEAGYEVAQANAAWLLDRAARASILASVRDIKDFAGGDPEDMEKSLAA